MIHGWSRRTIAVCLPLPLMVAGCLPLQRPHLKTLQDLEPDRSIVIEKERTLDSDRRQALQRYRDLLATRPDPAPDPAPDPVLEMEARRRLADLQLELQLAAQSEPDTAAPEAENGDPRAAIRIYEDLLATFPNRPGNDQVLYQLARAYDELGDTEQALATLDRLADAHPQSRYAAEVHFRRGEMRFLLGDYAAAAHAYEAVLSLGPDTPYAQQARYKYGWSLFKRERYEAALDAFFAILDSHLGEDKDDGLPPDPARRTLVQDTLRVVSLAFSHLGGSRAIERYLQRRPDAPSYTHRLYTGLGDFYLEKERFHDAAQTFQAYARRHPQDVRAPAFLIRAIEAFERGGFPSQVLAAKNDFVERYALDRPFWQAHEPASLPDVVATLQVTMAELARHHHARAQRSGKAAHYAAAVHAYRRYLENFPTAADAPELHYLLAEALFESGRYAAAARAYEQVAYDYPPHARGPKAAHAALVAHRKHLAGLTDAGRLQAQRLALASALRLADGYPQHPQAPAALAKAAQEYFVLGEYDPAVVAAQRLLALSVPVEAELRLSAWLVLGHSAFDQGDYAAAEQAYTEALALMPVRDGRRAALAERLGASLYKQGEALRAAGELAAAAERFLQAAAAAPHSELHPTAEYDAAAAFIALEQWPRAIEILEAFRRDHPRHPLQEEIPVKLAAAYLENGQRLAAAREFARLGTGRHGTAQLRREALWRAAELYAEGGKATRAASTYKRYLALFPQPFEQALEARQRLAELNRQVGNTRRYHYWLRQVIDADAGAGTARTARSRLLAARAALELARPALEAFRAVRLTLPLEKTLKRKKARMEQALAAYQRAADYGIAEVTTAATYRIAEIYQHFGRALLESQRPPDLDAEALEQYDILLEEQAYPFEEEAIALHEVNRRRAAEGLYDRWVKASFRALAELLPVRYAKSERSEDLVETIH